MPDLGFVAIEGDWMGFFEGLCKIQDLVLVYCGGIRCDWRRLDGIGWDSLKVYARYRTLFWFVVGDLLGLDGLDGIIWESLGSSGIV